MEGGKEEESEIDVLIRLLKEQGIALHTTIHNPLAMSALDQGLLLIKQEFGTEVYKFCKEWTTWYRRNMVAEGGKRAEGILKAVAAKIEEKKQRTMAEKALGDLNR